MATIHTTVAFELLSTEAPIEEIQEFFEDSGITHQVNEGNNYIIGFLFYDGGSPSSAGHRMVTRDAYFIKRDGRVMMDVVKSKHLGSRGIHI